MLRNRTILGAVLTGAVGLAVASTATAADHNWKMQSLWQAGSVNQKVFANWTDDVKKASGGRIEITPLPVGAVVGYAETLDAVGAGILEGHHSGGPYFSGKEPALALTGDLSGGFENPYQMQMWFYYGGGIELAREIYKKFNIHYIGPVWWGVESIPAKKAINTLEDFKGVKVRVPEGLGAEIDLGAWELPDTFRWLAATGGLAQAELLKTFNAGIGMVLVVAADRADALAAELAAAGESVHHLGHVVPGAGVSYTGVLA